MEQSDQALEWAIEYLTAHTDEVRIYHEPIVQTSYSVVNKIKISVQTIYLKQTPELLFSEPRILTFLKQQDVNCIPKLVAENPDLLCFLMTSCGDKSLRHIFNKKINFEQLKQGIHNFTKIQRTLENKISELLKIGAPDWRLDQFSSLYYSLIQQDKLLISDGMTEEEINHLHQLHQICINLCERLSEYKIPETLAHCDFHDNNMLLDNTTQEINIIDLGETVIAHPFFSLNGCLWNITYFYATKETDLIYKNLQSACVASWANIYDETQLLTILNLANKLQGVFAALAYERIYVATKNQRKTVQQEHYGSIAGCLRTFINSNLD